MWRRGNPQIWGGIAHLHCAQAQVSVGEITLLRNDIDLVFVKALGGEVGIIMNNVLNKFAFLFAFSSEKGLVLPFGQEVRLFG